MKQLLQSLALFICTCVRQKAPNELTVLFTLESFVFRQKPNSKRPLLLLDRPVKERLLSERCRPSPAESAHYTHPFEPDKGKFMKKIEPLYEDN